MIAKAEDVMLLISKMFTNNDIIKLYNIKFRNERLNSLNKMDPKPMILDFLR